MTYEIRVKDHLDPCWHDWFDGWTITNLEDGEVLLTSTAVDQSALHGTLNRIRDLNLKLISVVEVDQPQSMDVTSELNSDSVETKNETTRIGTNALPEPEGKNNAKSDC